MGKSNIWKNLKLWLAGTLVAGAMMMPNVGKADGDLRMWNYSSSPGINENKIIFLENGDDSSYLQYPITPAMETYYEDSGSNQYSVAGVNPSINKYYNCPLAGNETIPDGTSNSIAFKIVRDFPSNTFSSAEIMTEGGYSNLVNDVIAYTKANSNAQGYAFIQIPATTNASNRVYGNVRMRFAPLKEVTASAGAGGTISPSGTIKIPMEDPTNFQVNANSPSNRIAFIQKDGSTIYTNSTGDNSLVSTNVNYGPVTNNGSVAVGFEPKTFSVSLSSAHGDPTPANGTYVKTYGDSLEVKVNSPDVSGDEKTRYLLEDWGVTGNDYTLHDPTNISMIVTNDAVVSSTWKTQYIFNASAGTSGTGRGIISGGASNGWYDAGSTIDTPTAIPDAESYFSQWTGSENTKSNPASITMNSPKTEEASYKKIPRAGGLAQNHSLDITYEDLDSDSGQEYIVESTTDLKNWGYETNFTADTSSKTIVVPTEEPQKYFRLKFVP